MARICTLPILLIAAVTIPLAGDGTAEDIWSAQERAWLVSHPTIRVGLEVGYPPFTFVGENGYPQGISVDYLHLLEQKLGVKFQIAAADDLYTLLDKIKRGELDVITSLMKTPGRSLYMRFTAPYISIPAVIIVRNDYDGPSTIDAMTANRIVGGRGYAVTEYLERKYPKLDLLTAPNDAACLRMVSTGEVEAAVVDLASASYLINSTKILGLRVLGDVGFSYVLSFASRMDSPELQRILDVGLRLITSEEARKIRHEWIQLEPAHIRLSQGYWLALLVAVIVATLLMGLVWGINRTLRAQVAKRTEELERELIERQRAETALRDSEERYRKLFETMPTGVVYLDATGKIISTNPAAQRILGLGPEQILGRSAFDPAWRLIREDGSSFTEEEHPAYHVLRLGQELHGQLIGIFNFKLNQHCWISINSVPQFLPGENVCHQAFVTFEDVTERRRAESAVRSSEQRYRDLVELSPDAVFVSRGDRVEFVNRAALDLFGATRAGQLVGQSLFELIHPKYHANIRERIRVLLEGGVTSGAEEQIVRLDGTVRDVEMAAAPFRDEQGVAIQVVVREITERKNAERAIRASEGRFRALIERSSDLTLVMDEKSTISFASPASIDVLGKTPSEMTGKSMLGLVHPEDKGRLESALAAILANPAVATRTELRMRRNDEQWALLEVEPRNLLDVSGVRGIVVNSRDITERNRFRDQLQQAQKLESIGRLAGGVAHDFNNLLTIILTCSEELKRGLVEGLAPSAEDLDDIIAAGRRASELTKQLLAFARKQIIAPETLDLNELLRNSKKLLGRVLGEDVRTEESLQPDLWPVRCDPGLVSQVVLNLAVNARDAMPGGGTLTLGTANVELTAGEKTFDAEMAPGQYVKLMVRDSGPGLPLEVMEHLFEPFFTTKPVGMGTGLGLATVYGIVKQSGAYLTVKSVPGEGATFEIYFPRATDAAMSPENAASPLPMLGTETVLVVEDDPKVREVAVRALRRGGYRVLAASGVNEAVELARREQGPLHLVLTDVVMPELSGREVARQIGELKPGVRVLYVSGYTRDAISKHGVLDEGIDFLAKPFTASSLLYRVRAVLDRH